jgi:ankyrin repeat protein
MKPMLLFGLCLLVSLSRNFAAQVEDENPASVLEVRFALNRLFGSNACTAESLSKVRSDAGRMAIAENFALLDGNVRVEMGSSQFTNAGLSQVDAYNYGLDKVTIFRPDLRLCYTIFPQLKAYLVERASTNSRAGGDATTVRMEERGEEELEGHACVKRLAVFTGPPAMRREVLCWFARDLKNFPIRIQFKEGEQLETITYRNVQFARPDRSLFEPPRGFTLCRDTEDLMTRAEKMQLGAPVISNKTYAVEDNMAALIKFTLRSGVNRPVGSNTANAFGLGSRPLPATQIALGSKDNPIVSMFGVSQVNSNDLFFARIDQNARSATIWLVSPSGNLRGTILTSTNGPPKVVPIPSQEKTYEEVRAAFFSASEPPIWEDAPHPLHVAAKFGELSDVQGVLKRDEKAINSLDEMGDTPLNCAVVQENVEVADFLLAHGADPNIPNRNGLTPLEQASSRGKDTGLSLAKLLLAHGAQPNPTNATEFKIPPLEWAVTSDNLELVNLLLDHGASVKSANTNGNTPLHTAASRGDLEIAETLLKHGADANAAITGGTTPLHEAAEGGFVEIAELLLKHGAEVNSKIQNGMTPLLYAAGRGAEHKGPACFELLLSKGGSLDATDDRGNTPLHLAVYYGNQAVVESLLRHNVNVNVTNKSGGTPLQSAKKPEIAELLRQHGAK